MKKKTEFNYPDYKSVIIDGVEVMLYRSPRDGTICIQIDTANHVSPTNADGSPQIRVYINDEDTYIGRDVDIDLEDHEESGVFNRMDKL